MTFPTEHEQNLLTTLRRSVWQAINEWPALQDVFRRKNDFDNGQAAGMPAAAPVAICDLPAIEIFPTTLNPEWETNRAKRMPYVLQCNVRTAILSEAEWILPQVWAAIHRSAPEGSAVPYVKTAGSLYPRDSGWTFQLSAIGQQKPIPVILGSLTMLFELRADPLDPNF